MANSFEISDLVARCGAFFTTDSTFLATADRSYEGQFTQKTYEPGNTISYRKANRGYLQRGKSLGGTSPIQDRIETMTILPQFSEFVEYIDTDPSRFIHDFEERVARPAAQDILQGMNREIASGAIGKLTHHTPVVSGNLSSYSNISSVITLLRKMRATGSEIYLALANDDANSLRNSLSDSFNTPINTEILRSATLGSLSGMTFFEENDIAAFVNQDDLSAVTNVQVKVDVPLDVLGTSTITLKGLPANTYIDKGTILDFPTYFWVDAYRSPLTVTYSNTVAVDAQADGAGDVTLTLSEPITPATLLTTVSNVDRQIVADSYVSLIWKYVGNIAYSKFGLHVATPPLPALRGIESSTLMPMVKKTSKQDVLTRVDSLRLSLDSDLAESNTAWRLDAEMAFSYDTDFCCLALSNASATTTP